LKVVQSLFELRQLGAKVVKDASAPATLEADRRPVAPRRFLKLDLATHIENGGVQLSA